MAVVRESSVAEAHASGGEVHVLVADALTPAEAKALCKEIKRAAREAAEFVERIESVEGHVHDIFAGLFEQIIPPAEAKGDDDGR